MCKNLLPRKLKYHNVFPEKLSTLIDLMRVEFKASDIFCKLKKMKIYEIKFCFNSVHKIIDNKGVYIYIYICMCVYIRTYMHLYIHIYKVMYMYIHY